MDHVDDMPFCLRLWDLQRLVYGGSHAVLGFDASDVRCDRHMAAAVGVFPAGAGLSVRRVYLSWNHVR